MGDILLRGGEWVARESEGEQSNEKQFVDSVQTINSSSSMVMTFSNWLLYYWYCTTGVLHTEQTAPSNFYTVGLTMVIKIITMGLTIQYDNSTYHHCGCRFEQTLSTLLLHHLIQQRHMSSNNNERKASTTNYRRVYPLIFSIWKI